MYRTELVAQVKHTPGKYEVLKLILSTTKSTCLYVCFCVPVDLHHILPAGCKSVLSQHNHKLNPFSNLIERKLEEAFNALF